MMKKLISVICLLFILTGCMSEAQTEGEHIDSTEDVADEQTTDDEYVPPVSVPEEPDDDIPVCGLTEEEKSRLTLEAGKIELFIWPTDYTYDQLGYLKNKYPDLEMISEERYKNSDGTISEGYYREIWYSETTGLTYLFLYYESDDNGIWKNELQRLSGQVSALIPELTRIVEISELMDAIGIPESDWAVGEAPDAPENYYYDYYDVFSDLSTLRPDDIIIIVPDAVEPEKRYPDAIKITPQKPGFIGPTDEFIIQCSRLMGI